MLDKKNIMLFVDRSRKASRGLIKGIFKYAEYHENWHFHKIPELYLKQHNVNSMIENFKKDIHGIITYVPYAVNPERMGLFKIPSIVIPMKDVIPGTINILGQESLTGELAAQHLLSLGLQHFAFCGDEKFIWSRERQKAFSQSIGKSGKSVHCYKSVAPKLISVEKELPYIIDWLKSLPKPVGVLAWNDDRSELLIEACKISTIKIPEEVALLGIDNDELICNLTSIPLSSIEMNFEKAGFEAARILDQMLSGRTPESNIVLVSPIRVIKRKSTDILAFEEPEITKAVHFIKDNAYKKIRVDDVVNQSFLSKRTLQKRFVKYVGKTIQQAILENRAEKASHLLIDSDLTISQIAYNLHYSDISDFNRSFKKIKKRPPMSYRHYYASGGNGKIL